MSATEVEESRDNEWLPDHCPSWCEGGHAEALAEGNGWESAQEHLAGGPGGLLGELRNPVSRRVERPGGGAWNLNITQRPRRRGGFLDEATVNLEVHDADFSIRVILPLTSGEARVLAAQLVAMADRIDL